MGSQERSAAYLNSHYPLSVVLFHIRYQALAFRCLHYTKYRKQRLIRLQRKRGIENGVPDSLARSVLLQQKSSAYALLFHIGY